MGLPIEGLREPAGLLSAFLATAGDARDFEATRGDEEPALLPVPVPVLVPVLVVVPVPEVLVDDLRFLFALDSSSFTSLPTTKLFVVTKLIIHSGISPLFVFCFCFFSCFGEVLLPALMFEGYGLSVFVEGGEGVPGLKNLTRYKYYNKFE